MSEALEILKDANIDNIPIEYWHALVYTMYVSLLEIQHKYTHDKKGTLI